MTRPIHPYWRDQSVVLHVNTMVALMISTEYVKPFNQERSLYCLLKSTAIFCFAQRYIVDLAVVIESL